MTSYITKEKLKELKEELENLRTIKRAEVAERLKHAKELGDLSENIEYSEAREEQAKLEARIMELERFIKSAVIIEKKKNNGAVRMGSTVTAEIKRNKKQVAYTIVGSKDADPSKGLISNESPVGEVFLGKKIGDEVTIETPAGKLTYKIIDIR